MSIRQMDFVFAVPVPKYRFPHALAVLNANNTEESNSDDGKTTGTSLYK